jgi:GNAT superfamily N-acetyltransferase
MSVPVRRLLDPNETDIVQLADVLADCVEGGASVSFMLPMTAEKSLGFWRGVAADVRSGTRILLVAEDALGIAGTVQVILGLPENQPHRGDLTKMLVHRRARNRGVGAALLRAAEDAARDAGRTLLVLDTVTGGAGERLYQRLGWSRVGEVPDYALWPGGCLCPTTYYYRRIGQDT